MKNTQRKTIKTKNFGQVFTPAEIVFRMLDLCNYNNYTILNKKIIEPSFGDGAFLTEILIRLLTICRERNFSISKTQDFVKNNIFGIEKDNDLYNITISKLNTILFDFGIFNFDWSKNLFCEDTLCFEDLDNKFDIVIGNPPYVNIHNIEERNFLSNYNFSKDGMTDLYICFFEKGLKLLNKDGKLCFITPNSYFNSIAGKNMREYIIKNTVLSQIINFGHQQIFDGFTTYSCITLLDKTNKNPNIFYVFEENTSNIDYEDFFINGAFYFSENKNFKNIIQYNGEKIVEVKNGFATLNDNFFINSELANISKYSIPIIKSSTGEKGVIFYPYDKNGKVLDFSTFENNDIMSTEILINNKELLLKRSLSADTKWYEFGRTQAIKDTYKNKFGVNALFKTKNDIRITNCPAGTGVYGGLYILTDCSDKIIKEILCSENFIDYCKFIGKYKSGGYYTISSKELSNFLNYYLTKRSAD